MGKKVRTVPVPCPRGCGKPGLIHIGKSPATLRFVFVPPTPGNKITGVTGLDQPPFTHIGPDNGAYLIAYEGQMKPQRWPYTPDSIPKCPKAKADLDEEPELTNEPD